MRLQVVYSVYYALYAHNIQQSWHQEIKKAKGIESFSLSLRPSITTQVGCVGTFESWDEHKIDNDGNTDDMLLVKQQSRDMDYDCISNNKQCGMNENNTILNEKV